MDLAKIRDEINSIDNDIVQLLERRFELVTEVGEYKKAHDIPIFDAEREKIILENIKNLLQNPNYKDYMGKIYNEIMNTCKDIQKCEVFKDCDKL